MAAAASTRLMPGSAASVEISGVNMMRIATVPSIAAQSAIVPSTAGSLALTGLMTPNRPGWAFCTPTA